MSISISASVRDVNDKTINLTADPNTLVKYFSSAEATMSATSSAGLIDLDMYIIKNGSSVGYGTSHTFANVENNVFTFSAQDSTGAIEQATVEAFMIPYVKLTCYPMQNIINGLGEVTVACYGNYFNSRFGDTGVGASANTLTAEYRWQLKGGSWSSWRSMTTTLTGNAYYASAQLTGLDYTQVYNFQVRATDKLMQVNRSWTARSVPLAHWGESDFTFEVPVKFNGGIDSQIKIPNPNSLIINGQAYDGTSTVNANIRNGTWTPTLNAGVSSYTIRQGWYQKVGNVVTIGWMIKASIYSGYDSTALSISGVPYTPYYSAFGGGVAHNINISGGFAFEGWGISDSGVITARLQPCNNTSAGNLNISSTSYYPSGGGTVTLAGTICYRT